MEQLYQESLDVTIKRLNNIKEALISLKGKISNKPLALMKELQIIIHGDFYPVMDNINPQLKTNFEKIINTKDPLGDYYKNLMKDKIYSYFIEKRQLDKLQLEAKKHLGGEFEFIPDVFDPVYSHNPIDWAKKIIEELIIFLENQLYSKKQDSSCLSINTTTKKEINPLIYKTLSLYVETGFVQHEDTEYSYGKSTAQFILLKELMENKINGTNGNILGIYDKVYSKEKQVQHSYEGINEKEKITKLRDDVHKTLCMTNKFKPKVRIKINNNEIYLT